MLLSEGRLNWKKEGVVIGRNKTKLAGAFAPLTPSGAHLGGGVIQRREPQNHGGHWSPQRVDARAPLPWWPPRGGGARADMRRRRDSCLR